MTLSQLRALLATVNGRGVHEAGRLLHRSQPAVTASLAALEKSVGQRLLEKSSRGTRVTAAGQILATRIATGLERLAAAAERAGLPAPAVRRLCEQTSDAQLSALAALVECGGFSAAARALAISQPSVHRAVGLLADLLGTPLWTRAGRSIEPTPQARAIATGVDLLRSELRLARQDLLAAAGRFDGSLLVGALPTARAAWLPRTLVILLHDFPQTNVSIMDGPYEEQLAALRRGRIDLILGVLREPGPGPDIAQEGVFEDTLSIVVRNSHPLARASTGERGRITAAQIASLRWLLPPEGTPARTCFHTFLNELGLPAPAQFVDCNSFLTIRAVLLETDYAAVVSTSQVGSDVVRSRLAILGAPLRHSSQPVGWALRAGFRPTQLQKYFMDTARAQAAR